MLVKKLIKLKMYNDIPSYIQLLMTFIICNHLGAIIGTYQERGATTFWNCALRLPLKENPVTCWKFCHVLHKVK